MSRAIDDLRELLVRRLPLRGDYFELTLCEPHNFYEENGNLFGELMLMVFEDAANTVAREASMAEVCLVPSEHRTEPARVAAYLDASLAALPTLLASPVSSPFVGDHWFHEVLDDSELRSHADLERAILDPERRARYLAARELEQQRDGEGE